MPSPNSTFTEMVTTTLRNHARKLVDNVTDHNGLLRKLKANGNIQTKSGGYEIVFGRLKEQAEKAPEEQA